MILSELHQATAITVRKDMWKEFSPSLNLSYKLSKNSRNRTELSLYPSDTGYEHFQ